MPFEDVMAVVSRWSVATEALAALGAQLALEEGGVPGDPSVVKALRAVSLASGCEDLEQLAPAQRHVVLSLIRLTLRQSLDLLEEPGRSAGWVVTDPRILEGWGRASMMIPALIAASAPELGPVTSFLDVGTGVGLLAIAAAEMWPTAEIVGVDIWPPSLAAAAANVARAGLGERITLREQDIAALDDVDTFDCAWCPTFFLPEPVVDQALPGLRRALRPGGWVVLGRLAALPDPLAEATLALRTIRSGGASLDAAGLMAKLEQAGFTGIRVLPRISRAPVELVVGQRPPT